MSLQSLSSYIKIISAFIYLFGKKQSFVLFIMIYLNVFMSLLPFIYSLFVLLFIMFNYFLFFKCMYMHNIIYFIFLSYFYLICFSSWIMFKVQVSIQVIPLLKREVL